MRRRTYLAGLAAGTTAAAGCGTPQGQDGDEDDDPDTATPTPTAAGEPDVRIVDAYPGRLEFDGGEVVDLTVEVRNDGGDGTVPLRVDLDDETVLERSMEVEGERHREAVEIDDVADGYHEFTVAVGNDTASGTFTVGLPVERPRVVTAHTVLGQEERTIPRADRLDVDVAVTGDPATGVAPPDREALLDVCRKLVLEALESNDWDVVRFRFWRESQAVGDEAAHATVTWGPEGNWSGVGTGADGDYSGHRFDVTGAPYLVIDGLEAVQSGRWSYRISFDLANQGVEPESVTGRVWTGQTDVHRFAVDLEPGERTTVGYEDTYVGSSRRTTYTIEADGDDRLYGPTSGEIEFS